MSKEDLQSVSIALKDNAYDFIEKGLESIISNNEKEYKFAILHLYSGILVFLKDLLHKEHWALIFQKIDEASFDKLISGDLKSVNFSTLINRLKNIEIVNLSNNLTKDLEWVRKERNKIEHFHNNINPNEVKSRIASLLNNIIIFIREHKESDESYSIEDSFQHNYEYEELLEMIQDYSFKFESFANKRMQIIKEDIQNSFLVIHCPSCNQKTVELNPDENLAKCHFCLNESTLKMFYYMNSPVNFDQDTYDEVQNYLHCPECGENNLFEDRKNTICFNCFTKFLTSDLSSCPRCDKTVLSSEGETTLCDSCLDYLMDRME